VVSKPPLRPDLGVGDGNSILEKLDVGRTKSKPI
jgi:hypothetical protein